MIRRLSPAAAESIHPNMHPSPIGKLDQSARIGLQNGIHYATGCQGSGVAMMTYLGMQVARKIITVTGRQCGLDGLPFPTRPFYNGKLWFLPAVGA
jgi:glycine/D-amino acid oxidase-like deaminating enzyme